MSEPRMQVVLVALPGVDVGAIEREVQRQCDALPRSEVARQALAHSCIILAAGKVRARSAMQALSLLSLASLPSASDLALS